MRAKVEKAEEELENLYKERKVKLEAAAIGKKKRNPKAFFSYAKRYSKTFCRIVPFLEENGEFLKESEAETLKKQCEKVFSKPKKDAKVENPEEFFEKGENKDEINSIHFTESDVKDAIDKLSQNAAAGPDGIPAVLIKKCKDEVAKPLYMIFRKSLETGEIPAVWKTAHVIPILKPGANKSSPSSYRPVSLTLKPLRESSR